MTSLFKKTTFAFALATSALASTSAMASGPTGIWIDHTGRGAVEIVNCGGRVCGRIVWLKDSNHADACGMKIIGDAKPVNGGKWDNGWIRDPDRSGRFSVEITPMGDKLKVVGYAGSKFLSETMIWHRAPQDLKRCG